MHADNPFEREGRGGTVHVRRKIARQEMVPTRAEQAVHEQADQLRQYHKWRRQVHEGVKRGEYASELMQLLGFLKRMPEPAVILRLVENAPWLREANDTTREVALELIDVTITRWHIRHGLPCFDDGVLEPGVFVLIRRMLNREGI